MIEKWKDIDGYDGRYQVSNFGNVRTTDYNHTGKTKLLKLAHGTKGYMQVCLTKDNKKSTKKIHRLVAEAFIENPFNYPTVNHIDENKENNNVENLEWCTFEYNTKYGTRTERCGKPIKQLSRNGDCINIFKTSAEAQRKTGVSRKHIVNCCKQKPHCLTAGGYKWVYA